MSIIGHHNLAAVAPIFVLMIGILIGSAVAEIAEAVRESRRRP